MMRVPVRTAFGLTALLIAPSFATAQVGRDVTSVRDGQPSRAFSRITFDGGRRGPAPGPLSTPSGPPNRFLEGARLPEVTAAPEPHGTGRPCVMRVVPVDPGFMSLMPTVSVDERGDPQSVIKVPECKP